MSQLNLFINTKNYNAYNILNMKRVTIIVFLSLFSFKSFAQINETLNIKSPQAADFVKFGNIQSSKHNGLLNLSIPLFNVSEGEFSESVSISYNSSGFMPAKRGGMIGLNWHLNVGGTINRTVRGVADEYKGNPGTGGGKLNGFYYGISVFPLVNNDVYTFSSVAGHSDADHFWENQPPAQGAQDSDAFEAQPDLFSFNFHGISGTFYFNNQGGVEIIPNQPVHIEVDMTNFQLQDNPNISVPKDSEIIFKVDNGYSYYFGGSIQNIEFTIPVDPTSHENGTGIVPKAVINTWNLTKVIAPSGKEMIYEYDDITPLENNFTNFDADGSSFLGALGNGEFRPIILNKYVNQVRDGNQIDTEFFFENFVAHKSGSESKDPIYEVSKQSYLKRISTSEFEIEFQYEQKTNLFLNDPTEPENTTSLYNFKDQRLKNILLFNKVIDPENPPPFGSLLSVKSFNFEHVYFGDRMFLSKLTEFGKPSYEFEYNATSGLPRPDTHSIDHWGFWNGGNSHLTDLIPIFISDEITGDRDYGHASTNDFRAPTYASDVALLSKVIYPTKGHSEFEYEPHMYSKRLDRNSAHNFLVSLENMNTNTRAGGARIKTIRDFDGIATTNERTFYYSNGYSPTNQNGTSSGILLKWPRYAYFIKLNTEGSNVQTLMRSRSSSFNTNAYDGFHMSYGEVTEVSSNSAYKTSYYSTYETNPDIENEFNEKYVADDLPLIGDGVTIPANLYKNYKGQNFNDTSIERGKLIAEKNYNNQDVVVSEGLYEYNTDPTRYDNFVAQIHSSGGFFIQATKRYMYPNFLSKETSSTYLNNTISQSTEYVYDPSYYKLRSQTTSDSKGDINSIHYKYPFDFACNNGTNNKYALMIEKNLNDFPVEVVAKINTKVKSVTFNEFDLVGNQMQITESRSLKTNELITDYNYLIAGTDCLVNNYDTRLQTDIIFDQYDTFGNVVQYHRVDGPPTVILWGHIRTKPIAKIENATYSQITSIIDLDTVLYLTGAALEAFLDTNLRNNPALSTALVTTYSYKPLVGIETITDPRGQTNFYYYDISNRLEFVKDEEGKILSKNEYNYKN